MPDLVSSIRIPDLVTKLRDGEYLIPKFQREFVWSTTDVIALLTSIIDARPIGMLTIWEQPDDSGLELEHVSIPDGGGTDDEANVAYFGDNDARPSKYYAVLDGRQRSTAIAMAFGGLSATDARRKHAGRYFLNVAAEEPVDRIQFKKLNEIDKLKLSTLANCISLGLFPFELDFNTFPELDKQWMHYTRSIEKPDYYKNGQLPSKSEMERRISTLESAFRGIIDTTFAVYSVPRKYDLGTICEIFETLNTTGTRVSTVDLIHSWIYSDTRDDTPSPMLLREWIRDLGQRDGAVGWADPGDRPELIAQFVTATYLAEKNPSRPRRIGGKSVAINSVKSGDLLATPTAHWKNIAAKSADFALYLGDFQRCVADGRFRMKDCPYPITGGIYLGLRWTNSIDERGWSSDDIGYVFKAFFWRNALTSRYDQGFLTKMATDLKMLLELMEQRNNSSSFGDWAKFCNTRLSQELPGALDSQRIGEMLLETRPAGALGKALMLRLVTTPKKDILEPGKSLDYHSAQDSVELHHIYPKAWIRDNIAKNQQTAWANSGRGGAECIANLTPMLRTSNNVWRAKIPGRALQDAGVTMEHYEGVLRSHFIDKQSYAYLEDDFRGLPEFWEQRAGLVAADLAKRCLVSA